MLNGRDFMDTLHFCWLASLDDVIAMFFIHASHPSFLSPLSSLPGPALHCAVFSLPILHFIIIKALNTTVINQIHTNFIIHRTVYPTYLLPLRPCHTSQSHSSPSTHFTPNQHTKLISSHSVQ